MECGKSLALPKDIPWKRLAYSVDMVDPLMDAALPRKWRSSVTVFYYELPEEEIAEDYRDRRLVYLKVSATITGYNFHEAALGKELRSLVSPYMDESEYSSWEAWMLSGWRRYYPCYGAILQVAVFPHQDDLEDLELSLDEFGYRTLRPEDLPTVLERTPYITDFEPKKREVFEARTESGEFLTGSSSKLNTGKSQTNTESLSVSGEVGVSSGSAGAAVGVGYESTTQDVTYTNKEWSREKRESHSHTTNINQIYSIFDGYHLGTNRAVFVIQPRPHIVDSDFNLIEGIRRLEGIQDVFLVLSIPKTNKGFCVQANLDTGHIYEFKSFVGKVKLERDMSAEDYNKTFEALNLSELERDLQLEGYVHIYNSYFGYEPREWTRHDEGTGREKTYVIEFHGEEVARGRDFNRIEYLFPHVRGRLFGEDIETGGERCYVIYELETERDQGQMFMTQRTVRNCARFDEDLRFFLPEPMYVIDEQDITFETPLKAPPSGLTAGGDKPALVHNYNEYSKQLMRGMIHGSTSCNFSRKGIPLSETQMFRRAMTYKLMHIPDNHPENIELSSLKKIDKNTLAELEKSGIRRIKDLFVPRRFRYAREEPLPHELLQKVQSVFFGPWRSGTSQPNVQQKDSKKRPKK